MMHPQMPPPSAAVDAAIAPAEICQNLIADRAAGGGEVIDPDRVADEGCKFTAPSLTGRTIGDIHRQAIHRDSANQRTLRPSNDHLRRCLPGGGTGGTQEAVAVSR